MPPGNPQDPATKKQINRIRWWAEKLGTEVPPNLTKAQASALISEWAEDHEEFLDEWEERAEELRQQDADERERREAAESREWEIEVIASDVDDWREFYKCRKVPTSLVERVVGKIGSMDRNEPIGQFMDRFFDTLRIEAPQLFSGPIKPPKIAAATTSKKSTQPITAVPPPLPNGGRRVLFESSGIRVDADFLQCSGTSYAISKMSSVSVFTPPASAAPIVWAAICALGALFGVGVEAHGFAALLGMAGFAFALHWVFNRPKPTVRWVNTAGQGQFITCDSLATAKLVEGALLLAISGKG